VVAPRWPVSLGVDAIVGGGTNAREPVHAPGCWAAPLRNLAEGHESVRC